MNTDLKCVSDASEADGSKTGKRQKFRNDLTADRVRELLDYNPETGKFRWRVARRSTARVGSVAGTQTPRGYTRITINRTPYFAHRLAWLWVHGEWPPNDVDHADRDPRNGHFNNLRSATRRQNQANRGIDKDSSLQIKGVYRGPCKYIAQIRINGKITYLGGYNSPFEAWLAYAAAVKQYNGEYAYLQDAADVRRLSDLEMSRRASQQQQLPLVDAPATAPTESLDHETV